MATANAAKQTRDAKADDLEEKGGDGIETQATLGDMVPGNDELLEELVGKWLQAKSKKEKAEENLKSAKAALRDAMVERELQVYHCTTTDRKVVAKDELTVRVVKDTPDGSEG